MGVIQTALEVRQVLQSVGDTVGSTAAAFSKGVGTYVCNLYEDYPGWLTGEAVDAAGFASSVRKGFLNEICGQPPTPTTKKCWRFSGVDGNGNNSEIFVCGEVPEWRDYLYGNPAYYSPYIDGRLASNTTTYWGVTRGTANISQVTSGGYTPGFISEGDCSPCLGNTSPTDPPNNTPPPPGDLIQNYTVNVVNNEAPQVNFTIPFAFVDFSPKLDTAFNFNITLDVGGQRIDLDFGPEGIKIPDPPPGLPPNSDLTKRFDDLDKKADDIRKRSEECCANSNPVTPPEDFDVVDKEPEDPKEETDLELLAYVEVLLTKKPKNAKGQSGGGTGPDLVYAGWFEFKRGTYSFPRSPIHFGSCVFKAPIGADGYAYTLYVGYEGKHTVYKFKKDEI